MHRNLNSQFKNTLCEKKSRQANAQLKARGGGGDIHYKRNGRFTLETDYSCEIGYLFVNLHQIGNTS